MTLARFCAATCVFFSLVLPLTAQVTGSGSTNFVPIWTNSFTQGNSSLFQIGGKVGIRTTSPAATLDIIGPSATNGAATAVLRAIGGNGGINGAQ